MPSSANRRPAGPPGAASRPRRTRVLVIVGLFAVAVVASALIGWRFARESVPVAGPIVLISIDPLPAGGLSFYGGTTTPTPYLDRLAAASVVFGQAFSHAPSSLPAHISLLTGRLPFEHGVRDNVGFTLDAGATTLASRLADRGFDTAAAVSTALLRPGTGISRGFATYDAGLPEAPPDALVPPGERSSAETARAAIAWLDHQGSERFFYALHLNGDEAGAADAAAGAFLEALRRKGWYDEALVVVTSAYGGPPAWGDDPGRGYTLAAPVLRVPLVVKMPGAVASGRFDAPVQHIDLTPTLLDLVRAPGDAALRGRSLRSVLEDDATTLATQTFYGEAMSGALRHGWAELTEPADAAFPSSVATLVPEILPDAERDRLALVGEVAPTIPRAPGPGAGLDPRSMGQVIAAYRRAARYDATRAFSLAIAEYRNIVQTQPEETDAWRRLGVAARRLGRFEEASDAFTHVTALRAELGVGALEAARVAVQAGQPENARLLAVTAAEATSPRANWTRAEAHGLLATLSASAKDADEALAHAKQAEETAPGVPFVAFMEGRLLHDQEQHEEALVKFDAAVTGSTRSAMHLALLQWYRGDSLARLDRHVEALEAFEAAIVEEPLEVRAYTSLATLQRATNRREDAAATVERLVRAVPTPEGYATAVRLSTVLGNRGRAAALRAEARVTFKGEPGLRLLR